MEAHPCDKESFLDKVWRYINEIVRQLFLLTSDRLDINTFVIFLIGLRSSTENREVCVHFLSRSSFGVIRDIMVLLELLHLYFLSVNLGHYVIPCRYTLL